MLKLIVGVKGTGKTKTLINLVNGALEVNKGDVVCIEKGTKLRYDIRILHVKGGDSKACAQHGDGGRRHL